MAPRRPLSENSGVASAPSSLSVPVLLSYHSSRSQNARPSPTYKAASIQFVCFTCMPFMLNLQLPFLPLLPSLLIHQRTSVPHQRQKSNTAATTKLPRQTRDGYCCHGMLGALCPLVSDWKLPSVTSNCLRVVTSDKPRDACFDSGMLRGTIERATRGLAKIQQPQSNLRRHNIHAEQLIFCNL